MNRTWLVTDATSGFGRQIIGQLLERGDRVAAIAENPLLLQDLKVFHTTALHLYRVAAGDVRGMRRALGEAFSDLGTVDVVMHGVLGSGTEDHGRGDDPAEVAAMVIESAEMHRSPESDRLRNSTLTPEQFRRLVPGLWGVPHPS